MIMKRKKFLSQWIDTISQKSNFFTDDQYYTVGQASKNF